MTYAVTWKETTPEDGLREKALHPPAHELRTLREAAGLTKQALASELGVALGPIYAWEDGRAWPTIDKLPRLAIALGVDVGELVDSLILTRRKRQTGG